MIKVKVPPLKISFSNGDIVEIISDMEEVLKSSCLTLGEKTHRFENEFARMHQRRFAVAVNSGTTALEIFLRAREVESKTVIVPTNTNYATAAAVLFAGGILKLVDGELFPSLKMLRETVNSNTAGIIIVHIGGYLSEELEAIRIFCKENNLFLLEDAAHAHGASLSDKMAGSFGDAAAFSFFPTKVITSGEGGMLVMNDEDLYQKALIFRDQGKDASKKNILLGNSWRMSEFEAVVGFHQLKRLKEYVKRRNEIMKRYNAYLSGLHGIEFCGTSKNITPSGYKYIIKLKSEEMRNKIKSELADKYNISAGGGVYDVPIHQQPIFRGRFAGNIFPRAEEFCSTHLCLPIWSTMKDEEVDYVIGCLTKMLI